MNRFAKIEFCVVPVHEHFAHVVHFGARGMVDCDLHEFVQGVVIDTPVVTPVGAHGNGIEYPTSNNADERLDDAFFCTDDGLVGDVLAFGLLSRILSLRNHGLYGCWRCVAFCCFGCRFSGFIRRLLDHRFPRDYFVGMHLVDVVGCRLHELAHSLSILFVVVDSLQDSFDDDLDLCDFIVIVRSVFVPVEFAV